MKVYRYPAHFWTLDAAIADAAQKAGIGIESVYHDYDRGAWVIWHK